MKWLLSIGILAVVFLLYIIWQNHALMVGRYTFTSEKLPESMNGYKIAQISDLHNKRFGKKQSQLLRRLAREAPNLIVITGDLVDSRRTNFVPVRQFLMGASKLAPLYYVTGNHEHRFSSAAFDELMQCLSACGAVVLNNRAEEILVSGKGSFFLIGLFNPNLTDHTLGCIVDKLPLEKFRILLAHQPQYFSVYAESGVDFIFSGHVHGGQWWLPGIGGLFAPGQGIFPRYTAGLYQRDGKGLAVSRGLGNSLFPIRLNNRPEIVTVTFGNKNMDSFSHI